MSTDIGLLHLWQQGDLVTRAVAVLLLAMSLASWTVIVVKALDLGRYARQSRSVRRFRHPAGRGDAVGKLGSEPGNPFGALAAEGREAAAQQSANPRLRDALGTQDWITRAMRHSIDESTARLQSGLAVLASVGSTAPFVGLFGTVWGIYHALAAIGTTGQATIDKVAGPVGEALIMTALGLAVAIPAVLGYNALVRGNKGVLFQLNRFAHDLHGQLLSGATLASGGDAKLMQPAAGI